MNLPLLISALIMVESSGNDHAIGKDGKSFGCLQITDVCREDVNRIAGFTFTRGECFHRVPSVIMLRIYLDHYCTAARLGREPTLEDAARIWNGGPNGWKKSCTLPYWKKVKTQIKRCAK